MGDVFDRGEPIALITAQISAIVLRRRDRRRLVDLVRPFRRAGGFVDRRDHLPGRPRRRHLGRGHTGRVGLCDHQLCVVDRHCQRWHVDLGDLLSRRRRVAHVDHPHCRIDDGFCRRLRRHFPDHPSRPPLAVLLAGALSQRDGRLAAIPQSLAVGLLRDPGLRPGIDPVLVSRASARPRDLARPRADATLRSVLRRAGAGLARLGSALAALSNALSVACRVADADRGVDPQHRRISILPPA